MAVVARLKEFRLVTAVCECNANNFAAMVQFGMIHESSQHTVTVQAELVQQCHSFPEGFRGMSLLVPPCTHSHIGAWSGSFELYGTVLAGKTGRG